MLYGIEEVGHLPVMLLQVTLNPLPLFLIDKGFYSRFPLYRRLRKRQPWPYAWLDARGCVEPLPLPPPPGLRRWQEQVTSLRLPGCAARSR